MRKVLPLISAALCACLDDPETRDSAVEAPGGSPDETAIDTGPEIVWDRDQDGFPEDEDCNDYDAEVFPGAAESWNAVDDDCNGRIDADGTYAGTVNTYGDVVIEGIVSVYDLDCPTTLVRDSATLEMELICSPQEQATIDFLGDELILRVSDTGLSGAAWDGRAELSSSQGWSTQIVEISMSWTEFSQVSLVASMSSSTASLSMVAEGSLDVEEGP